MARLDPHSFTDDSQPTITHFSWQAHVDFAKQQLRTSTTVRLKTPTTKPTQLTLDTRGQHFTSVRGIDGAAVPFEVGPSDPILGAPLQLALPAGCDRVSIDALVDTSASALQWLTPAMTHDGVAPYLFSQCQALHARSILPCQDTPTRRVTYDASLTVPKGLVAVMAAAPTGTRETESEATFSFAMPQAIPPYLFAFAVGRLASADLSVRSRVWAEPGQLKAAAFEFADVERHLAIAEGLFGPYGWDRFDLLVMPPSFPYGGMENPRLTFLTPALLAGDKSLVNVVAHELAHSWTGNFVTNATAEHFWLNEGFTVYAERRIIEALDGEEEGLLQAALGLRELLAALREFERSGQSSLTVLRTALAGVDPDEAFSVVPYEKGYLLLLALERHLGRARFDAWLQGWLAKHAFGAVTTDDFIASMNAFAPEALEAVQADDYLYREGLPASAPRVSSARLEAVQKANGQPDEQVASGWGATEWQLFLDLAPRTLSSKSLEALDARWGFSTSGNVEIQAAWLQLALESGLMTMAGPAEAFLSRQGRMKYLKPVYRLLHGRDPARALTCFQRNQARYHPIARQVVAKLLGVS